MQKQVSSVAMELCQGWIHQQEASLAVAAQDAKSAAAVAIKEQQKAAAAAKVVSSSRKQQRIIVGGRPGRWQQQDCHQQQPEMAMIDHCHCHDGAITASRGQRMNDKRQVQHFWKKLRLYHIPLLLAR